MNNAFADSHNKAIDHREIAARLWFILNFNVRIVADVPKKAHATSTEGLMMSYEIPPLLPPPPTNNCVFSKKTRSSAAGWWLLGRCCRSFICLRFFCSFQRKLVGGCTFGKLYLMVFCVSAVAIRDAYVSLTDDVVYYCESNTRYPKKEKPGD